MKTVLTNLRFYKKEKNPLYFVIFFKETITIVGILVSLAIIMINNKTCINFVSQKWL